jgi:hypothetical protein
MKTVVIVVMIPLLIGAFGFWSYMLVKNSALEVIRSLDALINAIEQEDWSEAADCSHLLQNAWDKASSVWEPFKEHDEIDALFEMIIRTQFFAARHQREEALAEAKVARSFAHHMYQSDLPGLGNIF